MRVLASYLLSCHESVSFQVQESLAEGLWIDLDPRTDRHCPEWDIVEEDHSLVVAGGNE